MAIPTDFTGDNDSDFDDVQTSPGQNRPQVIDYDYEDNVEKLQAAYLKYLGRQATDEEIDGWVSGRSGGGIDAWVNQIQSSNEAKRYAARSQTPQTDPTPPITQDVPGGSVANIPEGTFSDSQPTDFTGTGGQDDPWDQPGIPDPENPSPPPLGPDVQQTQEQKDRDRASGVLQRAYREHLGREITGDEIEGWWSGDYGWGQAGYAGLEGWLRGIKDEGDRLKADSQTPQPDPTPPTTQAAPRTNVANIPEGTFSDFQANQGGNTYQSASQQIQDAYRQYLDRDASPDEISKQLSGGRYFAPENVQHAIANIQASKEAREYRMGQAAPAAATPDPNTGNGTTTETGVPARTGQAPSGWDQRRWSDPEFHHVKYDVAAFLYGVTSPSEVQSIVQSARFQAQFPGATFNGENTIDFGPTLRENYEAGGDLVGSVSVLKGADEGGDTSGGLHWSPSADTGTAPSPGTFSDFQPGTAGSGTAGSGTAGSGSGTAGSGTDGSGTDGGWTQPPDSVLSNPAVTPGPPTLGYGMGQGGGGGTMGQIITPYNPLETYSPTPYTPPAPFRPPAYQGATPFGQDPYAAADPFAQDPYSAATPFTAPTAEDMAADPSYQFRLRQGQEALERSGAARGVTNTGGTLKDILDYGQQAASQEYGNVYGRQRDMYDLNERNRFNAYQANYGNAMDAYGMNERNRFNAYQSNYGNAMDAYNMNERNRAGAFDRNVGTARDAYAMNEENRYRGYTTNEMARWQQNQEAENRRSGAYNTNLGAYERQQQYGLRAQGQGYDQAFRNWTEQSNQRFRNQNTAFNQRYLLGTT